MADGDTKEAKKREIERSGRKVKGRKALMRHLEGKRLTRGEAILAKCYDCTGYYSDGGHDCGEETCPLYPYMPRRGR